LDNDFTIPRKETDLKVAEWIKLVQKMPSVEHFEHDNESYESTNIGNFLTP
jgi:hypothetical protein